MNIKDENLPENTVAVFNDGNSVIVVDDHCYCLKNKNDEGRWGFRAWIFKEALDVIKAMPDYPDDAGFM